MTMIQVSKLFILLLVCHITVAKLMVDEGKRICKDEDECRQKFISLNNGGYFFTNTVNETLKGCFLKDGKSALVFFCHIHMN